MQVGPFHRYYCFNSDTPRRLGGLGYLVVHISAEETRAQDSQGIQLRHHRLQTDLAGNSRN